MYKCVHVCVCLLVYITSTYIIASQSKADLARVHAVYNKATTAPHSADLAVLRVPGGLSPQEDGEGGGLGPLGDVNDLLQAGDPEGHVLGRHTGVVEGVEGHLGGRFSQRLGGQGPHHLPRLGLHGRGGCGGTS